MFDRIHDLTDPDDFREVRDHIFGRGDMEVIADPSLLSHQAVIGPHRIAVCPELHDELIDESRAKSGPLEVMIG